MEQMFPISTPTFLTTRKNSVIFSGDIKNSTVLLWHKGKDEKDFTHFANFLF